MELQIIHKAITPGNLGKKLVVSVLFKFDPSYEKGTVPFLDDIETWGVPDLTPTERRVEIKKVNLSKLFVNGTSNSELLDIDFSRATYYGSLTSPPCDENTTVMVATKPLPIK